VFPELLTAFPMRVLLRIVRHDVVWQELLAELVDEVMLHQIVQ
jgi:hypothetical protein